MDELMEMIAEIKRLNPKPGLQVRLGANAAGRPRRARPPGARRQLASSSSTATRCRGCSSTAPIYTRVSKSPHRPPTDKLSARVPADRQLAGEEPRPARTHDPAGRGGDRAPAGRLLHARRPAPAAAQPEDRRRRDLDARIDGQSRVTSNKYMATPRGIFELKYFFTSAIASADEGESHSSEAVRHRIKQMIDGGSSGNRAVRRQDRREAEDRWHRYRPAHRRQVPRSDAHPLVRPPAPREAALRAGGAAQLNGDGLRIGRRQRHDQDLCLPPGCNIGAVQRPAGPGWRRKAGALFSRSAGPVRPPRGGKIQDTEAITSGDRLLRVEFVALFLQRMAREWRRTATEAAQGHSGGRFMTRRQLRPARASGPGILLRA